MGPLEEQQMLLTAEPSPKQRVEDLAQWWNVCLISTNLQHQREGKERKHRPAHTQRGRRNREREREHNWGLGEQAQVISSPIHSREWKIDAKEGK